ncbi:hypothetical protein EVAR_20240_1 [Eumeta japonica]|uniref:Uncharacterized protein n=1 Tax=Eumeta variegata TaxID=151549 RepID=A0A4C1W799_EUMVA|nr:hypothetical protein EVAR_20240_1 [Eumeta japonica]
MQNRSRHSEYRGASRTPCELVVRVRAYSSEIGGQSQIFMGLKCFKGPSINYVTRSWSQRNVTMRDKEQVKGFVTSNLKYENKKSGCVQFVRPITYAYGRYKFVSNVTPFPPSVCMGNWYACAVAALVLSEVSFGAWLGTSLWTWWRESPRAALARQGLDIVHDLKPILLTLERHQELARALYQVIEETEREAPNNVFVIIVFALAGCVLQVAAVVAARRLWRDAPASPSPETPPPVEEHLRDPPQWRKKANLRMYTILDKIF